jgi:ribosomal protein S12 methylthiotransferase accessory factor
VKLAPAPGGGYQARWDFDEIAFLSGPACERVLPWLLDRLDGRRSAAELGAEAPPACRPEEVAATLRALEEHGLLAEADDAPTELHRALAALPADPAPALARLAAARAVVCGGSPLAAALRRSLVANGLARTESLARHEALAGLLGTEARDDDDGGAFLAVVETDWRPQDLEAVNAWALARRRPWMLLAAWNRRLLVGPIFVPGEGPCYECHRGRLGSHRRHLSAYRVLEALRRAEPRLPGPEPVLPALADLAAGLAASEVFSFISGLGTAHTPGRVLVYQPEEARLQVETLLRIPWCPACSQPQRRKEPPASAP